MGGLQVKKNFKIMMKQHPAVKRNVLCSLEQETQCTRKKTSVQSTEVAVEASSQYK